jgi:hypothetical protein
MRQSWTRSGRDHVFLLTYSHAVIHRFPPDCGINHRALMDTEARASRIRNLDRRLLATYRGFERFERTEKMFCTLESGRLIYATPLAEDKARRFDCELGRRTIREWWTLRSKKCSLGDRKLLL